MARNAVAAKKTGLGNTLAHTKVEPPAKTRQRMTGSASETRKDIWAAVVLKVARTARAAVVRPNVISTSLCHTWQCVPIAIYLFSKDLILWHGDAVAQAEAEDMVTCQVP